MSDNPAQTQSTIEAVAGKRPDKGKPSFKARAIDEGKRFLIITAYLWVFFAMLSLYRTLILQQEGVNYAQQTFAIINALIFAKVVLVADDLKLGTRLVRGPLIYPILYTSFIFAVVLVCFHIAEGAVVGLLGSRPIAESLAESGAGSIKGILSLAGIAFVAMLPFFTIRGIGRAVGEDELWQLVFSREKTKFRLVAQE